MNRLSLLFFIIFTYLGYSQTDGITYQAVIIDPYAQEIPGSDISGNFLPNVDLQMRFTILDENGSIEFQEVHSTSTDTYGMINIIIGQGVATFSAFTEILWYGNPKDLKVEINLDGSFSDLSQQPLLFVPYAYHRDIIASGDLFVSGNSVFEGDVTIDGITNLNNDLIVNNASESNLSGILDVDGATTLNNTLDVTNGSATNLSGTLTVEGETTLNNTLDVNGATTLNNTLDVTNGSATNLSGTLTVEGETALNNTLDVNGATTLNDNLDVLGETNLEGLSVKTLNVTTNNTEYIATLSNTNEENGDGMLIKLGRTHGAWNGNDYLNLSNPYLEIFSGQLDVVQDLLDGNVASLSTEDIFTLFPDAYVAGGIGQLSNLIIEKINGDLDLPINFPDVTINRQTIFQGVNIFGGYDNFGIDIPSIEVPPITIPETTLLESFVIVPEIPPLPSEITDGLPTISSPNFNFNMVNNSLTSENKYITFQDKDGKQTGAIKAMSSTDFRNNTVLDGVYLLNALSKFVGVDLLQGFVAGTVVMSNIIDEYNSIGVEYASGNGDYAEWLERLNQNEYLSPGDIVAVKGGKISKTIENFEQLMVVSYRPIVLGNVPQEDLLHLGNNVAFMGQVPVKVMGSVEIGDYIIAHEKIKGYGQAVSPEKMTANQFKKAVGRAWEKNNLKGPKLINTVVGIHNGDWKNLFENLIDKQNKIENDLESIEKKILKIKLLKLKKKSLALKTNEQVF